MPQRHPRSSPGCPTQPRGSPTQSGTGSDPAESPARDRTRSSASCRSAAVAQSGRGASRIAERADGVKNCNKKQTKKIDVSSSTAAPPHL